MTTRQQVIDSIRRSREREPDPRVAVSPDDIADQLIADDVVKVDDRPLDVEDHELVIRLGDEELHATCACGVYLGFIKPDQSLDSFATTWERHAMTGQAPRPIGAAR